MIGKEILDQMGDWMRTGLEPGSAFASRLLLSAIIIGVLLVVRLLVERTVARSTTDPQARHRWRKGVRIVASILGIFFLGAVWIEGVDALATFVGLIAAALVFVLKEPIGNLAGWVYLVWWHPYRMGDRIQVGDVAGDVVDIRLFQTVLIEIGAWVDADQSTGRIVHVPNGRLFVESVRNYTQGFSYVWHEIPVRITFDSDWKRAKATLLDIVTRHGAATIEKARADLNEASKEYLIQFNKITPIVYTTVREYGILLTARYLCRSRTRRNTEEAIWEDVLEAFAGDPGIRFAYPTTRFVGAEAGALRSDSAVARPSGPL
jgi:small-conductance mechanosensitive channel